MRSLFVILGIFIFAVLLYVTEKSKFVKDLAAFSRILMCLLMATGISREIPLVSHELLDITIWTVLLLGVCYALCILPRTDCAVMVVCYSTIAMLSVLFVFGLLNILVEMLFHIEGILDFLFGSPLGPVPFTLIVLITTCVLMYDHMYMLGGRKIDSIAVNTVDRVIASVIYGLLIDSFFLNIPVKDHPVIHILIVLGIAALMYIVDLRIFDRLVEYGNTCREQVTPGKFEAFHIRLYEKVRDSLFGEKESEKQ